MSEESSDQNLAKGSQTAKLWIAIVTILTVTTVTIVSSLYMTSGESPEVIEQRAMRLENPRTARVGKLVNWWDKMPQSYVTDAAKTEVTSNVHPADYAGAESCRECHTENYNAWSTHPHRFMNAYATKDIVKADFSDSQPMSYFGGKAHFYQEDGGYRMRLERDNIQRVYQINQTIGSRFQQYYIGKLIKGPEPSGHDFYNIDHVLPFGYWIDEDMWVPVVHTHDVLINGVFENEDDIPSADRHDPFGPPSEEFGFVPYFSCNICHTTMPLGDLIMNHPDVIGRHIPHKAHFEVSDYLKDAHPDMLNPEQNPADISDEEMMGIRGAMLRWEAPDKGVNLGISCEACHMGAKAHVEDERSKPLFFASSPHFKLEELKDKDYGRNHANVNWMCGRCHTGDRPQQAAGMATWNSTEYTDAMRGSCYTKLQCIDCHEPHTAIGKVWPRSPAEDDQSCVRCHQEFKTPDSIRAHTHHTPGTEGARCMNCHMPRINEGLQDVVRTHTIFSPTNKKMIEQNQPNACNMCHAEKPIDWTLEHLDKWYGKKYSDDEIAAFYPNRKGPTAKGWLESPEKHVRLVAADVLTRTKSFWAIPELMKALDDPFLLNRQFTGKGIEKMFDLKLTDYNYRFYMTADERRESIEKLRSVVEKMKPVAVTESGSASGNGAQ